MGEIIELQAARSDLLEKPAQSVCPQEMQALNKMGSFLSEARASRAARVRTQRPDEGRLAEAKEKLEAMKVEHQATQEAVEAALAILWRTQQRAELDAKVIGKKRKPRIGFFGCFSAHA